MKPIWKYTIGLLVEVVIKVLQTFISNEDNVIPGTGARNSADKQTFVSQRVNIR